MKKSQFNTHLFFIAISLLSFLLLEQYTNIDPYIQNIFYLKNTKTWLITPAEHKEFYGYIFYYTIKQCLVFSGIMLLLVWIYGVLSNHLARTYHKALTKYLLALICIPLLISSLKNVTNVYCPNQTEIFNGLAPYSKLLEFCPQTKTNFGKGRCFPAGHASSGFLFFILFFCLQDIGKKRYRYYGLFIGFFLGWATGIYQMARGEHFFSHTITTMILAWLIALIINITVNYYYDSTPSKQTP
ncbi:MAG: phosphatase PAP2 family protein [Desulfovibrionaceae bacterium]